MYGEINQNKVASCFSLKDIIYLMCFEHITFKLQKEVANSIEGKSLSICVGKEIEIICSTTPAHP